jgi:hypothetical protein
MATPKFPIAWAILDTDGSLLSYDLSPTRDEAVEFRETLQEGKVVRVKLVPNGGWKITRTAKAKAKAKAKK